MTDKNKNSCLFCGESSSDTRALIQSNSGYCICSECIERCADIIKQKKKDPQRTQKNDPGYINLDTILPHMRLQITSISM